ncbi:Retrovirus-related Pol polyprotein from transposon RE1 [Vitis vinifera]|uniref:Retrovirus-related Pol polyprotein from transposon RE1 n=1 Tax=Vitis vinifera TaxID=29760 RepID=A0A438ES25_VITVI|nr:Retrovirus-related Pol polyprotein from transposon RE1 [Vitis vinifera]
MATSSSSSSPLLLNTMVHMLTIKLTSSNYLLWRNQFIHLLTSQDLLGFLDGSVPTPSPKVTSSNGTTQRGSKSVAEFSRLFKGLYDQLAAIGGLIDDLDKVHWFLRALAFYAQRNNSTKSKSTKSGKPKPSTISASKSSPSSPVYCQIYDKEGHLAKRCWMFLNRKKKQYANLAEAFAACSIPNSNDSKWYPDSGATSHLTNDPEDVDVSIVYSGSGHKSSVGGRQIDDLHASSHASSVISTILSSSPLSASISIPTTSTNIHPMVFLAIQEPRGFKSETKHPEWLSAMDDEIQALKKNDTWDLVPRPINHNVVGCRWIFKTKLHANGSIERHKARFVAKGFSQIHGLDFEDTFSPVADSSLFVHHTTAGTVYLLLYVDDMVLTGTNPTLIKTLITRLSKEFAMKDLGSLHYFLRVEVQHNSQGLFLSQTKYALDLLQRADMIEAKPISTPFVVEALQYLTITRSDLSFSVNSIFQYMHASIEDHFRALKRILHYVKGTVHHGLQLHRTSFHELLAYSDSDWAGCPDTRRSTSGYLIFFGANLVSWCSKKQSTVSRSSVEAEYRSLAIITAEVAWIVQLLRDLRLPLPSSPNILCNNKSALFMAVNPVSQSQSKHIAIDYHFVRELIANGSCYSFYHTQLAGGDKAESSSD